jgi:hypothetical protein
MEPRGECRPTSELWRLLAKEMGFDDPIFENSDSELAAEYILWNDPKMRGADSAYFKSHGFFRIDVGSADARAQMDDFRHHRARSNFSCTRPRTSSPRPSA